MSHDRSEPDTLLKPKQDRPESLIDLAQFANQCRRDIPLLTAMQLELVDYRDLSLTLQAPLAPNINNKGTAFGGSIASICLFGGWSVSTLAFMEQDILNTEIVVHRNSMKFVRPARGLLDVRAFIAPDEFATCLSRLRQGRHSKLPLNVLVEVDSDGRCCATMDGNYVVWLKADADAKVS